MFDDRTTELIAKRFENAPLEIQDIMLNGELNDFIKDQNLKFNFSTDQDTTLKNECALVLLAFSDIHEMYKSLIESHLFDTPTADAIVGEFVTTVLATISSDYTFSNEDGEPDISNKTVTQPVSPMRTMAKDMQKVHGYGALTHEETDEDTSSEPVYKTEQAAVLARPKMADTPTYTPDYNDPETSDEATGPSTAPATDEDARWKPRPEIQE